MQDGNVVQMNLRVETMPAIDGMDIVLRFFSFSEDQLTFKNLGMSARQQTIFEEIVTTPRGLVLIVGPTGSGKSTTLYSLLVAIRSPQVKIITLENPVEYQLSGITQIPIDVDQGASFAKGLRAVLRLDTDVVMVGEIRDQDTAQTALQAALTGHLVMSTYHAANASLALLNLLPLIKANPLFLDSIRLIQAQRLVRRLNERTKEAYVPQAAEREQLERIIETMPAAHRPQLPADLRLYRPPTATEQTFGYTQRLALWEFLPVNEAVKQLLLEQGSDFSPRSLEAHLCQHYQFTTMLHEGVLRVLAGETSLAELYRVGV